MREGYSYTSISAHPGQPVRIDVSFYLDDRAWIDVPGVGNHRPHLVIAHGDVSATVAPVDPAAVTNLDARQARLLADQAAVYAAEVERLAAANDEHDSGATAA